MSPVKKRPAENPQWAIALKPDTSAPEASAIATSHIQLAENSAQAPAASPARALQDALVAEFGEPGKRWSKRATLTFIVTTCGGFWAALGLTIVWLGR